MNKKLQILFSLIICIVLLPHVSFSQWQQVSGLNGEPVYSVRSTSSRLFALTQAGVYRSDNNGANWTNIPQLFLANVIERLAASGDTVLVFAQPESYISTDNGNTWSELTPPAGGVLQSDVAAGGGQVYMSTYGDYFYKSSNSGNSWTQVTQGLTTSEINCISTEGTTVFVGTDDGVFKSTDAGSTFTFSGLPGEYITKVYVKSPNVFAYTGLEIYKSADNGSTWQLFQPSGSFNDVTDFVINGSKVFASTGIELISSNLFAPIWQTVVIGTNIQFANSICTNGTDVILGTNRGVFSTPNNGTSWTEINNDIIPNSITAITVTPGDTLFAGASIYGVSRYTSSSWSFSGLQMLNSNSMFSDASGIYSASEFGIHKSSDGGSTWQLLNNTPGNPIISYCSDVAVADSLIIGSALQLGVLRSGDFGATWSLWDSGLQGALMSCITISGSNIIAGSYNNGIFTSTDGGFNWTQTAAAGEVINDVVSLGNHVYAASGSFNSNFLSTDGGLTWTNAGTGYYDKLSVSDSIIVGSSLGYIEVSRDSGLTFANNTPAPAGTSILSQQVTATDIYAGTAFDGVWKITISEVTGIEEKNLTEIAQAWIHPSIFTHESILYVEEQYISGKPELQIFDLRGQLVKSVNVTSSRTSIQANGLSKGVYFYRLQFEGKSSKTGKFVIQ